MDMQVETIDVDSFHTSKTHVQTKVRFTLALHAYLGLGLSKGWGLVSKQVGT